MTVIAGPSDSVPSFQYDGLISGWTPVAVSGTGRVSALTLERAGQQYKISCDAVILAGSIRPLRNVDGGIHDPADHVTFIQPAAEESSQEKVASFARAAAADLNLEHSLALTDKHA